MSGRQSLGEAIKGRVKHWRRQQLVDSAWRERHGVVFCQHPEYRRPCPSHVEEQHLRKWRQLRRHVSLATLRVCQGISGRADPNIVPEEIFACEVEPALNRYATSPFLANKSVYDRWLPSGVFPDVLLHNIDGDYFDREYRLLDSRGIQSVLDGAEYPVVIKPSMGSGGRGVFLPEDAEALRTAMCGQTNYVVQRKLQQHEFFRRFHDYGLNTMRVCTYRSVVDNSIHVLDNAALRMGRGGSLDNVSQGGMSRYVHSDGALHHYAVDKYGGKHSEHPDTKVDFGQRDIVPHFSGLKELLKEVARHVYLTRLVGFDVCLDVHSRWRIIELNLVSNTIRFAQYAGEPFFGAFTDEVIRYCKENPRLG